MEKEAPLLPEDPRIRLAAERTLLAWIRTGLAMMGFGFVVARFGLILRELTSADRQLPSHSTGISLWIGIALVLLGMVVNVLAAGEHWRFLNRLQRGEPYRPPTWSLGLLSASVLTVVGLVMALYLLLVQV